MNESLVWLRLAAFFWILVVADASSDFADSLTVYDNVLSQQKAEWLHEFCNDWKVATQNHNDPQIPNPKDRIFEFPLQKPDQYPPITQFLNELIWEMVADDKSTQYYVEYWTRQQWQHILAHQDMDEGWERLLRKQKDKSRDFKHPIFGHVLYLKIGSQVQGPTVVFDAAHGKDLMTGNTTMISVPAVEGRLLRFPGDRLHAVPRPADVYWTLDQSQNHIHTHENERSVLLFNLWKRDSVLVDKVLDCGDGKFPDNRSTCNKGEVPKTPSPKNCNPQSEWNKIPIVYRPSIPEDNEASYFSLLWEWLMGPSKDYFWEWLMGNSQEYFQIPLAGDEIKRGISGYVARMVSTSWWGNGKQVHPARENLQESVLPTWTTVDADKRFTEEL